MQQIGPQFRFREDEHLRVKAIECSAHGPTEIERRVKDGSRRIFFLCQFEAGPRRCRNHTFTVRNAIVDLLKQGFEEIHLSDADGVQPDRVLSRRPPGSGAEKAVGQSTGIFPLSDCCIEQPRRECSEQE